LRQTEGYTCEGWLCSAYFFLSGIFCNLTGDCLSKKGCSCCPLHCVLPIRPVQNTSSLAEDEFDVSAILP
jgi:hypothetical protein